MLNISLYLVQNKEGKAFAGFKPPAYKPTWVQIEDCSPAMMTNRQDAEDVAALHGGKVIEFRAVQG